MSSAPESVRGRNITLASALEDATQRYREATGESQRQYERACASLPGGNTRTVLYYDPYPLTIVRGEGSYVWDADGKRYTDFLGEYTAGLYGHSNPHIQAAIRGALDAGIVLCAPNRYESELAEIICERFPSCDRVRFCNSGTEGNLLAINVARAHTGREGVMVFRGGYHGSVFYFAAGDNPINAPYSFVFAEYNDAELARDLIEQRGGELAAIIVEPMLGGGGCIPADEEFLRVLRDGADRHGIVLIFDEVMTSRLSPGGLQRKLGIVPDLTSFGKYMGGGLTFGAFGGRREIMDRFDPRRADALPHAGTFNNNVLTMTAGLTGLRELYTLEVAEAHNRRGDEFRAELSALIERRAVAAQVTGIGSMLCVHFTDARLRRAQDAQAADPHARALFHLEMLAAGFYLARRGFMSLSLPLSEDDYRGFAAAFDEFLVSAGPLLTRAAD